MAQRYQSKALGAIYFKEKRHLCELLFNEVKVLNLTYIIALNNCILVFDHLNSSLPAIFDDWFKPFKEQHSHNRRGYVLNIPKMKTFFMVSEQFRLNQSRTGIIWFGNILYPWRFSNYQKTKNTLLWQNYAYNHSRL